ncbi:hypothetical protein LCGC14_2972450 [marine sediment metagenome]|uniref:Uncharacterized protein n=1 Tax=marine sediment metagenome TaxID=412755 RepID=A0A0F8XWG8_9ZZZZ
MGREQPVKLAAFEGLGTTQAEAPFELLGVYEDGRVKDGISIPGLLSIMTFHDRGATVQGLDSVPAQDQPPVNIVRNSFQAMIAIGMALLALSAWYGWILWRRRRLPRSRLFYWCAVAAGPLAAVALITGWIVTEVGRQPWIVYEVMRTSEAITDASGINYLLASLVVVYSALTAGTVFVLRRLARRPLDEPPARHSSDPASPNRRREHG